MDLRAHLDKIISDAEAGERSPHRALILPRLRPYLPDRHTVRVLAAGLAVIARAALRPTRQGLRAAFTWTKEEPESKDEKPSSDGTKETKGAKKEPAKKGPSLADLAEQAAGGLLILAIAAAILTGIIAAVGPHIAPYLPAAAVAGTVVLIAAAFIVAPDVPRKTKKKAAPKQAEPVKSPAAPPLDPNYVAALVRETAARGGWQGAHLADLLTVLPGRSKNDLLAALAAAGIPVTEQLKIRPRKGRQSNRQGVRVDSLPAGLGEVASWPNPDPSPEPTPVTVYGAG